VLLADAAVLLGRASFPENVETATATHHQHELSSRPTQHTERRPEAEEAHRATPCRTS
jgi:hypothetical protein